MAYEKEVLEKLILDVSEKFLFRYGYKNLNLNDVAKEINISKTTLYKTFDSKYVVASRVIERLLENAEFAMSELLQSELPLPEKLKQGIEIISNIYTKMDREFLYDLENSLPELWEKIDAARKKKESAITALLFKEQSKGVVRADIDPALLSALLLTLIRGMYNPNFFLTYNVTSDVVVKAIIDIFLQGSVGR
ncbi:MAG: TetR/AcrR family transcriptional regulator [Eubacteriales bacterium]|nr:TetR/AcrR family transcriptional regulator [Eubacteriales bacterium]